MKRGNNVDWQNRFNDALNYIEDNLDGKIDYSIAAKKALCSEFHFTRMFSSITDTSLSEYIRHRRLTAAAFEIQKSDIKIIDIALKYGYDSPDSFTRAFRKLHGVTPIAVRKKGTQIVSYPRISFQMTMKGVVELNYRIEEIDFEMRFAGKRLCVDTEKAFEQIPHFWEKSREDGFQQMLIDMSWEAPKCKLASLVGIIGETSDITDEKFGYFAGVRYDSNIPEGMEELLIPECIYAVFPGTKFSDTQDIWSRIYSEWLPISGYKLADLPCIEHYLSPDSEFAFEVWVPVLTMNE